MTIDYKDPKAVLAVCEAATPGPWEQCQFKDNPNEWGVHCPEADKTVIEDGITNNALTVCRGMDGPNKVNNTNFIALSRSVLPYWLSEAERLRAENEKLRAVAKCNKPYVGLEG